MGISANVKMIYEKLGYNDETDINRNIEKIKIKFWVAERPMATRLCLDKQIVEEYSVGIHNNTGQIIKKLFNKPIEDDEYLSVNFDTLAYSKTILDNLTEIIRDIDDNLDYYQPFFQPPNDILIRPELTRLNGLKRTIASALQGDKIIFNADVKTLNEASVDFIKIYKEKKLLKNIKDLIPVIGKQSIKDFVGKLEMGGKSGVLTVAPSDDLRKIPKQTSAQGWMELKKEVKKDGNIKKQYTFLTKIISFLSEYCELNGTDINAIRDLLKTNNSDLYWLIKNLGILYVKHSTNVHNIIANSIEQVAKESESSADFYLYISNLIENVVKLSKRDQQ